jgi:hypothetical protein
LKPAALIINTKADADDVVVAGVSKKSMLAPGFNSIPASIIMSNPASSIRVNATFVHTDSLMPYKLTKDKAPIRATA